MHYSNIKDNNAYNYYEENENNTYDKLQGAQVPTPPSAAHPTPRRDSEAQRQPLSPRPVDAPVLVPCHVDLVSRSHAMTKA